MSEGTRVPTHNPCYPSSMFSELSRQTLSMLCFLLGYQNDDMENEVILGFLSI